MFLSLPGTFSPTSVSFPCLWAFTLNRHCPIPCAPPLMSFCQTTFCVCACVGGNGDCMWATVSARCPFSRFSLYFLRQGPSLDPVWSCSYAPLSLAFLHGFWASDSGLHAFVANTQWQSCLSSLYIYLFSWSFTSFRMSTWERQGLSCDSGLCLRAQPSTSRCFLKKKKSQHGCLKQTTAEAPALKTTAQPRRAPVPPHNHLSILPFEKK